MSERMSAVSEPLDFFDATQTAELVPIDRAVRLVVREAPQAPNPSLRYSTKTRGWSAGSNDQAGARFEPSDHGVPGEIQPLTQRSNPLGDQIYVLQLCFATRLCSFA